MATSFGALCTDFYVNHKLALKLDLSAERESLLHFFDRVRKVHPSMNRMRRFENELALESARGRDQYRWLALKRNALRSGIVNPTQMEQAYHFHRQLLEYAPPFLSLSPLDVDHVELMFGFDMECAGNHDQVIYQALFEDSPLGQMLNVPEARQLDVQPIFGLSLSPNGDRQAYFEARTRPRSRRGSARSYEGDPISLFVSVRQYGPVEEVNELPGIFDKLAEQTEALASERLVPHMLMPVARHITSSNARDDGGNP